MSSVIARRRYLTEFEPARLPHIFTDVLVIGSGVAGLRAAIEAAQTCDVLLITKAAIEDSATSAAQGGIAAAVCDNDSIELHVEDTLRTACELGHPDVIRMVVSQAPGRIAELRQWGAKFDLDGAGLAAGREGGHSRARIIHADGDATGRELSSVLLRRAHGCPRLRIFDNCFAVDVLTRDGAALGAVTFHPRYGHQMFWADTTILASGGCGRVYRETTNPPVAVGDGFAMAYRAGAVLRDMEMVQFHPTTLYVAGASRALISEAVRGEGAHLLDQAGERFMPDCHPDAELAPRDVVSRAITAAMQRDRTTHVYLDARHLPPGHFAARFPNINRLCLDFDIDPQRDPIPVRPTAHYMIGGVAADARCRTNIDGLLACGESACSGLHGANRLASNALLEGLVMGRVAGAEAAERSASAPGVKHPPDLSHVMPRSQRTALDMADVSHSLRSLMSRNVGVERCGDRLRETIEIIEFWSRYVLDKVFDEPEAWQTQNLLTIAHCVALAAATRCESRGVHYRTDFPKADANWRVHIDLLRHDERTRISKTPLSDSTTSLARR